MLLIVIIILTGIGIIAINKRYMLNNYKILNPINIYIILWGSTTTVHYFFFGKNEYTQIVYFLILLSIFSFTAGYWMFAKRNISFNQAYRGDLKFNTKFLMKLLYVLTLIDIVRLLISISTIYKLSNGDFSLLITDGTYLRNLYLARENTLFTALISVFTTMNAVAGFVLLGLCNALKLKGSRKYLIIWTVLEFILCIFTMSKMVLFIYIFITAMTYFNNLGNLRKQIKELKKWFPIIALLILGLLVFIAMQRNYSTANGILSIVTSKALFYFVSPIEALSIYISENVSEFSVIKNTFWIVIKFFVRLGLIDGITISNHMQAVQTFRGGTNVYSWFLPFYQDLSYLGIVLYPFIWGFFAGAVYKRQNVDFNSIAFNSFFSCLFAMSFYFFLWGQGSYVYAFVYVFLLGKIFRKKMYVTDNHEKSADTTEYSGRKME